uniref:Tetraspanin n=1 Tax=Sinocyclocheilus anshuiensis TaxID=1608454 RepID=A0A671SCU2_9TELE
MGKGCIAATKYFLFMFNLLFFIFGAVILGFGLWVMLDNQKFITVLHESTTLKVGTYILIGIGSLSMLMGFLGCIGAIYEVRCLLGLYFTCLLLILIAQVTAAVLIYFQRDLVSFVKGVSHMMRFQFFLSQTSEQAWDYLQRTMKCCGWTGPSNWTENVVINSQKNNSQILYPCSCRNESISGTDIKETGLCEALSPEWPVFTTGCISSVEDWLLRNCGVILGVCVGIAVIEVNLESLSCKIHYKFNIIPF